MTARDPFGRRHPALAEFLRDQLAIVLLLFVLGILTSYLQHGFLPGGSRAFPVAGVAVPIWHLVWMGFWTGYTMALVGEATGIFSLPYSMSILRFESLAVTPTNLIITCVNPLGALLGFWREKRWNLDFALWPCLGTVVGSQVGPFLRTFYLSDPTPFKALVGVSLVLLGGHLLYEITPRYLATKQALKEFKEKFDAQVRRMVGQGKAPSGIPEGMAIRTVGRSLTRVTISFWDQRWTLSTPVLFAIGTGVGVISSTFGVGGGFLMTPILVTFFKMPIYVIVAASIPFVIVQSLVGVFAYSVTLPWLTGSSVTPEFGWAFFVASSAVFGAWLAAKTQKYVPERYLKLMLGAITALGGLVYVLNYAVGLPFKV